MILVERAKSDRSKCYDCSRPIPKGEKRIRIRVGYMGWGFVYCSDCVMKTIQQWVDLVLDSTNINPEENEIVQMS